MSEIYEKAGVSLEAGYESVRRIKKHIAQTQRLGMMSNIGSFGGMFDLSLLNLKEPVLVSGTDGVGTKLKLAFLMNRHDTVGRDLVAMCVNDVLAQGAEPLFFLDYIAIGKNNPEKIEQIVKGVADGCVDSQCALIGGETAEMPDMYQEDEYDLAGFAVGVAEKSKLIDGSQVKTGNVLIGLPSSGVHSNGFSLVRKIVLKEKCLDLHQYVDELGGEIGEILLTPTRIYVKPVLEILHKKAKINAICHITGGGFHENIPRALQPGQGVFIKENSWKKLPIFSFLEKTGNIAHDEMFHVFNMGIGMILITDEEEADNVCSLLQSAGEQPVVIGNVTSQEGVIIQ